MFKSEALDKIGPAIVTAQASIGTALINSTNPHFKSKYADLGAVWDAARPALRDNRLAICQFPDVLDSGTPALTTILIHESGQWMSGTYPLLPTKPDPQGYGSALTYAKRYGVAAVLGIIADEDDDAYEASKVAKPSQREGLHTPNTMQAGLAGQRAAIEFEQRAQHRTEPPKPIPGNDAIDRAREAYRAVMGAVRRCTSKREASGLTERYEQELADVKAVNEPGHQALMAAIAGAEAELPELG